MSNCKYPKLLILTLLVQTSLQQWEYWVNLNNFDVYEIAENQNMPRNSFCSFSKRAFFTMFQEYEDVEKNLMYLRVKGEGTLEIVFYSSNQISVLKEKVILESQLQTIMPVSQQFYKAAYGGRIEFLFDGKSEGDKVTVGVFLPRNQIFQEVRLKELGSPLPNKVITKFCAKFSLHYQVNFDYLENPPQNQYTKENQQSQKPSKKNNSIQMFAKPEIFSNLDFRFSMDTKVNGKHFRNASVATNDQPYLVDYLAYDDLITLRTSSYQVSVEFEFQSLQRFVFFFGYGNSLFTPIVNSEINQIFFLSSEQITRDTVDVTNFGLTGNVCLLIPNINSERVSLSFSEMSPDSKEWEYENLQEEIMQVFVEREENDNSGIKSLSYSFENQNQNIIHQLWILPFVEKNCDYLLAEVTYIKDIKPGKRKLFMFSRHPGLDNEEVNQILELKSLKNEVQMVVRECLQDENFDQCSSISADIFNALPSPQESARLMRRTKVLKKGEKDSIQLQFNCIKQEAKDSIPPNGLPVSHSCFFMIAVFSLDPRLKAQFQISRKNQNHELIHLPNGESVFLQGNKGQMKRYQINLADKNDTKQSSSNLKVQVISGKGKITINQKYLDENQELKSNHFVEKFSNNQPNEIKVQSFNFEMKVGSPMKSNDVYVELQLEDLSSIGIFREVLEGKNIDIIPTLKLNEPVQGQLQDTFQFQTFGKNYFYSEFSYNLQSMTQNLMISIEGVTALLTLCIQFDQVSFKTDQSCDLFFPQYSIIISTEQMSSRRGFVIAVLYEENFNRNNHVFPINFLINIRRTNLPGTFLQPQKINTLALEPMKTSQFLFSLSEAKEFAYLILHDAANDIEINIFSNTKQEIIATLDEAKRILYIEDLNNFKTQNCPRCDHFLLSVQNTSNQPTQIFFSYFYDNQLIDLQDSVTHLIPTNRQLGALTSLMPGKILDFKINGNLQKNQLRYKILNDQDISPKLSLLEILSKYQLDINDFQYLNMNDSKIELKPEEIKTHSTLLFQVYPLPSIELPAASPSFFSILTPENFFSIKDDSWVSELPMMTRQNKNLQKMERVYFMVKRSSENEGAVFILVQKGSLVVTVGLKPIYESKGTNDLPSQQISGFSSVLIPQPKKDESLDFFITIQATDFSKFIILFTQDSPRETQLAENQLISQTLNTKVSLFSLEISDQNPEMIFISESKNLQIDFYQQFEDQSPMETLMKADKPFKSLTIDEDRAFVKFNAEEQKLKGKYFVNIQTQSGIGDLNFSYFLSSKPIIIKNQYSFSFFQEASTTITFQIDLTYSYKQIFMKFFLKKGEVEIIFTDVDNQYEQILQLNESDQQEIFLIDDKVNKIFQKTRYISLTIKASESSHYSASWKPNKQYQNIVPFQHNQFKVSKNTSLYAYFFLNATSDKDLREIQFKFMTKQEKNMNPLMMLSQIKDIDVENDINFLNLTDFIAKQKSFGGYNVTSLQTKMQNGQFILKFDAFDADKIINIMINFNDENGEDQEISVGEIKNNRIGGNLIVKFPGVLNLAYETCFDFESKTDLLYKQLGNPLVISNQSINQTKQDIPFIGPHSNQLKPIQFRQLLLTYVIQHPGQLKYDLIFKNQKEENQEDLHFSANYYLVPEAALNLPPIETVITKEPSGVFGSDYIKIEYYLPSFNKKFLEAFQGKRMTANSIVYLMQDLNENFDKFQQCGKSMLSNPHAKSFDFTLEDYLQGNYKGKQEFLIKFDQKEKVPVNFVAVAYFEFTITSAFSQDLLDFRQYQQQIPHFILRLKSSSQNNRTTDLYFTASFLSTFIVILIFMVSFLIHQVKRRIREAKNQRQENLQVNEVASLSERSENEMVSVCYISNETSNVECEEFPKEKFNDILKEQIENQSLFIVLYQFFMGVV